MPFPFWYPCSEGNITHVLPSNLHCKYARMQSAHETMDIAPYQSVRLSAAIVAGVVAVSFSYIRYPITAIHNVLCTGGILQASHGVFNLQVKPSAILTFSPVSRAWRFNRWRGRPKASFSTALTALWQALTLSWDQEHWCTISVDTKTREWLTQTSLCKIRFVWFGCLRQVHVRGNHRTDIQQVLWESVHHRTKRTKASWLMGLSSPWTHNIQPWKYIRLSLNPWYFSNCWTSGRPHHPESAGHSMATQPPSERSLPITCDANPNILRAFFYGSFISFHIGHHTNGYSYVAMGKVSAWETHPSVNTWPLFYMWATETLDDHRQDQWFPLKDGYPQPQ